MRLTPALTLLTVLGALLSPASAHAQACCGRMDLPLGTTQRGGSRANELVVGAAYEYGLSKDGLDTELLRVDYVHTHRLALDVGYGVTSWLTPSLTVPLGAKLTEERIGSSDETRSTFGLGDVIVLAKITLVGADAYAPGKLRLWLAPGLKLPTGRYDVDDEFGQLPPPAQLGTGSWDPLAGVFASIGLTGEGGDLLLLGQALVRFTTENPEGYRFGIALDSSLALQLALPASFAVRAGPVLTWSARDQANGIEVANSGGLNLAGRVGGAWSFDEAMSLALDLELPIARAINGDQLDPVIRGSLGWIAAFSL